ncbi:uncharacterized protein LOC113295555 [Papaver somniferum]|uniref:uncharacterized protein LOC113295555 n=1 Tax=Papaver somniferum TaxID=3469 RepID=UPI000E704C73|nr:uncharacterized protein LOC113295555 [Papaver somniferum]
MNQGSNQTMSCNSEPRTYPCTICGDQSHIGPHCPLFYPNETTRDQVSVLHGGMNSKYESRPKFDPYSNTYNPGWRHNPNFSWSKGAHQGSPSSNPPQGSVRNNAETKQNFDTLGHRFDEIQRNQQNSDRAIVNIETQISQLSNRLSDRENGIFPSQPTPNPKEVNQVNGSGSSNHNEHVKAVVTLRSDPNEPESAKSPSEENIPERVYVPPALFPQRLAKKKPSTSVEILDIFKQVKIKNLPLLDAIKHVPTMAKFLKEMCIVKRDASVHKKVFLTQQVSSIISQKYPVKFKDPGYPIVTCVIGKQTIDNALLDFRASVNLLPFSVYEQLGLCEMKPTRITLQLADRSVKIPRGIIEDVLVQVENFIYPVDFVILDTQPVSSQDINIQIILGRLFLSTANAVIHCQTGLVEFSFGNQKISVNVLKALQAPPDPERYEFICMIDSLVENTFTTNSVSDPLEACLVHFGAYYDEGSHFEEVNALLDSTPVMNYGKWQRKPEPIPTTIDKPLPSSVKAPTLELKPLPDTLKYVFLGSEKTLPAIIASDLEPDQESTLVSVLREHNTAIGWTIAYLKGTSLVDCMHHIYLEEGAKTSREMQRRLNPNMKEVVRTEVLKLLDVGIIYPISDSKWVSPVQVVPKKSGITVVANENNELIPTRVTTGWRVCIDYRKLNSASRKDLFPLPFIDQMLERLAGHNHYCFLDGYSGYNQIPIAPQDQEKTTFTCPFAYVQAFEKLKLLLTSAPIIQPPNWNLPFELMCDASDYAVGAVLGQRRDKAPSVIYYASRTLNDAQLNYTTTVSHGF